MDEELTLEKLPGFKSGDVFVLEQTPTGRVVLRKKAGLEKLMLDAALDKDKNG